MNPRVLVAALLVVVECRGGASATVPTTGGLPVPPAARPAPEKPAPPSSVALADRILDQLLADDPSRARELGLHEFDGRVAPVSAAALASRVARLQQARGELEHVEPMAQSEDEALDVAELTSWVEGELFELVDRDAPHKVPQFYEPLFDVSIYVDRQYAPIEERAKQLMAQAEAAQREVVHIRENLAPPLSRPVAEVAARDFAGFATYLRGDVVKVMGRVGDDAQRRRFAAATEGLANAAGELATWLAREAIRGDQSHVLGAERYAKLLRVQEGLSMPLGEFARMNEVNLAANKKAYEDLAPRVTTVPVREKDLLASASRMVNDARDFVTSHGVVTIVSDDTPVVRETPPYERWSAASIEMSGPFESKPSAFYQLTFPDQRWPETERQAYLGTVGDLLGTTIHEVYPGHFVQGRWAARAPTRVQKAFADYAFVEGWAHYAEQMMIDEGFGGDPRDRLAQLHGALLRNCRFAASVGIHTQGMTVEQVERRFVEDCHQPRAEAREEAVRGTFDPGYFAYTLGKLQILALRQEAREKLGKDLPLRRFHDALLAHGAPPVALIHDRVLRDLGSAP